MYWLASHIAWRKEAKVLIFFAFASDALGRLRGF
jgi:hypothetical protein